MKVTTKALRFWIAAFVVLLLVIPHAIWSQPEGYKHAADTALIRNNIVEMAKSIRSINTQFVQEKSISFLEEKIISKGIMLYQSPDKLRLEYTEPFMYVMVMNGGRMMTDNGDKKSEYDLSSNKMFSEINQLIISSVKGDILNTKDFGAEVFENANNLYIRLKPADPELSKYISEIALYISKQDYSVTELQITEPSDDYTLIRFTNKKINESISPESFYLR